MSFTSSTPSPRDITNGDSHPSTWVTTVLVSFGKALLISLSILVGSCCLRFLYRFWTKRMGCRNASDDLSESCKYEMELQAVQELDHNMTSSYSAGHDAQSEIELPPSPGANTSCPPYNTHCLYPDKPFYDDFSVSDSLNSGTWHQHCKYDVTPDGEETTDADFTSVAGETTTVCSMLTGNDENFETQSATHIVDLQPPPLLDPPQLPPRVSPDIPQRPPSVPDLPRSPLPEVPQLPRSSPLPDVPSLPRSPLPDFPQVPRSSFPDLPQVSRSPVPDVPQLPRTSPIPDIPRLPRSSLPDLPRSPLPEVPQLPRSPLLHRTSRSSLPEAPVPEFQDYQSYVDVPRLPPAPTRPPRPDRGTELFLSQYYKSLEHERGDARSPPPV